jgi:anti-sigma regulatory factor (Ser/Thr protein kinase)
MNRFPLADKASVSTARRRIRADLKQYEVDPSLTFDCLVAVTEACTNALVHGHGGGPPPELLWEIDDLEVRFLIRDHASERWSMASHPSRGLGAPDPGDVGGRVSGFGFQLMRALMDEVDVRVGSAGTTVELVKRLGAGLDR